VKVVVLTGAGISAESGVPTFRDADGLWEGHRVQDVATPEAFVVDPETVLRFYDDRREALGSVVPNPAHTALAELEQRLGEDLLLVTQNIDDLHERAGSERVLHMHGELLSALCAACEERSRPWTGPMLGATCRSCEGELRPDVVWFGEIPYAMDDIVDALVECDLFVAIGTSGAVYPAAGFVQQARAYGARTLELNLVPCEGSFFFHEARHGRAGELVPAWVSELVAR
jgi:NAD-dependent deacetylase